MAYLKNSPNDFIKTVRSEYANIQARQDLVNGTSKADTPSGVAVPSNYPVVSNDLYKNIKFGSGYLGYPAQDKINPKLLADVNGAAGAAGVIVTVTTAITGHDFTPRHSLGNAVDIAIIDDKSVSPSIASIVDAFVNKLIVDYGYVKNVERGNPKAVLTYPFKDHSDHIHVSNNT